jgi:hypothetical protein
MIYRSFIIQSMKKEIQILLVIEIIQKDKKFSIYKVIKLYNIIYTIFLCRMKNLFFYIEIQANNYKIIELEKEMIV